MLWVPADSVCTCAFAEPSMRHKQAVDRNLLIWGWMREVVADEDTVFKDTDFIVTFWLIC